jgi:hypothetical protein
MVRLATQLDPMPAALQDPAAVHRWLAPLNEPPWVGGRRYWQQVGLDGDLGG